MGKRFLIVLRHAPYGRLDAAEAVRHLNGARVNGLQASLLLVEDGVYLARGGQMPSPGWTDLSAALADALRAGDAEGGREGRAAVYVHTASLQARGLAEADLVPGCRLADDGAAADLLAAAIATLVY